MTVTDPKAKSLATVCRYYDGCSLGDIEMMKSTLADDVTHFFLDPNPANTPITGAAALAEFWADVQAQIRGHWLVDNIVGDDLEAVVEWSLFWNKQEGSRLLTRGSEWFKFQDGLIVEIRAYYQQLEMDTQLRDFDYTARGYAEHGRESSGIHRGVLGDHPDISESGVAK